MVFYTCASGSSCIKTSGAVQVADLARGTFGFVQLAEDLTTGEHLAIKVRLMLTLTGTEEPWGREH